MKNKDLKKECHLMAYDLIKSTAGWLENPENEVFSLLEFDDDSLGIAAKALVLASEILKKAALDIQLTSTIEDTNTYGPNITSAMSSLEAFANELDSSGDHELVKRANVLDEILLTIAANVEDQENYKEKMNRKIDDIKKKSLAAKENKEKKGTQSASEVTPTKPTNKILRPLEAPLSTRYCPDHAGISLIRIRDKVAYCPLDGKQYDYEAGYTTLKGVSVPGSSIENQTSGLTDVTFPTVFNQKKND